MASSLGCGKVTRLRPEVPALVLRFQPAVRTLVASRPPRWGAALSCIWAHLAGTGAVLLGHLASAWSGGSSSPICLLLIPLLCHSVESHCSLSFHATLDTSVSQLSVPVSTCDVAASLCPVLWSPCYSRGPTPTLAAAGFFSHISKPLCPGQLCPLDA